MTHLGASRADLPLPKSSKRIRLTLATAPLPPRCERRSTSEDLPYVYLCFMCLVHRVQRDARPRVLLAFTLRPAQVEGVLLERSRVLLPKKPSSPGLLFNRSTLYQEAFSRKQQHCHSPSENKATLTYSLIACMCVASICMSGRLRSFCRPFRATHAPCPEIAGD